jgi:tripartite-type tricarboxylate transporter receptor subunit TctC
MAAVIRWLAPLMFLAVACAAQPARAQYPAKPIRLVVALPPGSTADSAARALAEPLSRALGQSVLIENKPGADGALAAAAVRNSPPDGYTLLLGQGTAMVGVPLTRKSPPYDPVADFTPISLLGRFTIFLFAHPDVPARTMSELVVYARANPGRLSYSTNSITEAIIAAQIAKAAGIDMVRVPYKGGPAVIQDLLGGRLQLGFMSASMGLAHLRQGRLRALATVLPHRSPAAPDIPTLAETGFEEATMTPWFALFGPAKLPEDVVARLSRETNLALRLPEVRAQFDQHAVQPEGSTPQVLAAFLRQDLAAWSAAIRRAEIAIE